MSPEPVYADLEIGPHRRSEAGHSIELRFREPDSDADIRLADGGPLIVQFHLAQLDGLADDVAYGQTLRMRGEQWQAAYPFQ